LDTSSPPLSPEILVARLGDYLVEKGLITTDQLNSALAYQSDLRQKGVSQLLGNILVEQGMISRPDLDAAVTEQIIALRSALVDANQQLEQRVKDRTADLEIALQRLSELNALKANFISNVSHELRTPMTHIKGYEELLLSGDLGPLNEQQTAALQVMVRSTTRLEHLIEDLLLFTMGEKGEFNIVLSSVSLVDVCSATLHRYEAAAKEKHINIVINAPAHVPPVTADMEKISWAVNQLTDNAVKFTPGPGTITLHIWTEDSLVGLAVEDTGIGIPEDRIPEIFVPFHQLDGSSTRKYGGTGLGLNLVQKIITIHGADLKVASQPGKGTRMYFYLKSAQPPIDT
jgi:signal transduction histidine kinase